MSLFEEKAQPQTFETIAWSWENHIATVTLQRETKRNAINLVMANELMFLFDAVREDPDTRVLVLRATGSTFCAGGDMAAMQGSGEETSSTVPPQGELHEISMRLRAIYKPVVLVAHAPVMAGGLMLVCNATHVVAATSATFSAPEIKRGLWPFMVMAGLMRVMPRRQALDFMMRGYKLDAEAAAKQGLATMAVPDTALEQTVQDLVSDLAQYSPSTMQLGLEACARQEEMDFDASIGYLMEMLGKTLQTADAQEGIMAFLQKRAPVFTGR